MAQKQAIYQFFLLLSFFLPQQAISAHTKFNNTASIWPNRALPAQKLGETYTIMIYMAADNDLFPFAGRNIAQLKNIGSNKYIKIAVQLDMHRPGAQKTTKRLFIEKNKYKQVEQNFMMDSGNPNSLIDFCKWAITSFPSDNYVLVLWNHGTGILEPVIQKAINPAKLFSYDPALKIIKLNRSIGFIDFINNGGILPIERELNTEQGPDDRLTQKLEPSDFNLPSDENIPMRSTVQKRGICFDDTTHNYLTNLNLKYALRTICNNYLGGKKFAIIACDACLMAMLEVAGPLASFADYLVASQEVELGTGYNYETALKPFCFGSLDKASFAKQLVKSYQETYSKITHDYTHSAIDLTKIKQLESNLAALAKLLIRGLKNQKNKTVKEAIQLSKHKKLCTHFDEHTYIDIDHLYKNIQNNIPKFKLKQQANTTKFQSDLERLIINGRKIIRQTIIANTVGKNLKNAKGLSIYFPEHHIHSSYQQSESAINSGWIEFLYHYIRA